MLKDGFVIIVCAYLIQGCVSRWEWETVKPTYYSQRLDLKLAELTEPHDFTGYVYYGLLWLLRQPLYAAEYWDVVCLTMFNGVRKDYLWLTGYIRIK